jgi:hypothetical protein
MNEQMILECGPNLFGLNKPFYFECGDGWYPLILALVKDLEILINKEPQHERERYVVVQIKEKFGTLRFYTEEATEEMEQLITRAEHASALICEECGNKGTISYVNNWLKTRCASH